MKTKITVEYEQGVPVDGDVLSFSDGDYVAMPLIPIVVEASNTITVDMSARKLHKRTITGNVTIAITNIPATASNTVMVELKPDSVLRTVSFTDGSTAISAANLAKMFQDKTIISNIHTGWRYFITITSSGSTLTDTIITFIRTGA